MTQEEADLIKRCAHLCHLPADCDEGQNRVGFVFINDEDGRWVCEVYRRLTQGEVVRTSELHEEYHSIPPGLLLCPDWTWRYDPPQVKYDEHGDPFPRADYSDMMPEAGDVVVIGRLPHENSSYAVVRREVRYPTPQVGAALDLFQERSKRGVPLWPLKTMPYGLHYMCCRFRLNEQNHPGFKWCVARTPHILQWFEGQPLWWPPLPGQLLVITQSGWTVLEAQEKRGFRSVQMVLHECDRKRWRLEQILQSCIWTWAPKDATCLYSDARLYGMQMQRRLNQLDNMEKVREPSLKMVEQRERLLYAMRMRRAARAAGAEEVRMERVVTANGVETVRRAGKPGRRGRRDTYLYPEPPDPRRYWPPSDDE